MAYSNKALPPGTILREWRLEQVLGVGGFGIVYKGRGIYFDELVAIKEYFPSAISERIDGDTVVPTDSDAEEVHALGLKKFVEEAKLLWNLSKPTRHPNIVSVRSLFEIHGTAYMVMDFEDGKSLSEILKEGKRFSEASLMALIRPISEGLERAHRVGVLHRDIKPPNILVSEDGRPVLIDFGSARFDSGQATSTKVTFHTPPYAAIEQYVRTYEQGPWTDIYALAVVQYECVTGKKPPEVLERLHGAESSALADGNWPGFSRSFLRAIDAGMTIRPDDRPQTISQWLALFDLDENEPLPPVGAAVEDAPTSFAAYRDLPAEITPVNPPAPPEAASSEPPAAEPDLPVSPRVPPTPAAAPGPAPAAKPRRSLAIPLALGAGVAILGAAYLFNQQSGAEHPDGASPAEALIPVMSDPAPTETTAALPAGGTVAALRDLASAARRSGVAPAALRSFDAAVVKADALAALPEATKPKAAALAEIDALAKPASAALARAVEADVAERARRLRARNPWLAATGAAETPRAQRLAAQALRSAQQSVTAAAARSKAAGDAAGAISAARAALDAAGAFAAASAQVQRAASAAPVAAASTEAATVVPAAAAPAIPEPAASAAPSPAPGKVTAKMQSHFRGVDSVVASARPVAAQVVELGNAARPGPDASSAERRAFTTRQTNARRAAEYMNHLELLSRTVRTAPSEASASGYVTQARTVKGYLDTLLAASRAAMPK